MEREVRPELLFWQTRQVVEHLSNTPYLAAQDLASITGLTPFELNTIYQSIRQTPALQSLLNQSANRDYFDTVRNHFGVPNYTAVFFVGLYCPARCHFCPSVTTHQDGFRELSRFKSSDPGQKKLDAMGYARIFADLRQLQRQGKRVSVKISGGLEPLTDPKTIGWILTLAADSGINTTLFTNGMLLTHKRNIDLALRSDNVRISLSTSNAQSYDVAHFGQHAKNQKYVGYDELKSALTQLIARRNQTGGKTRIGINTVAGEFNFQELPSLVIEASLIGVDYIEIKGEYFEAKTDNWFRQLDSALAAITTLLSEGRVGRTQVKLTGSLMSQNFINNKPMGFCLPTDQAAHKMFINPFGECTPVHYWAYPTGDKPSAQLHYLGALKDGAGLIELIENGRALPPLSYAHLNPFELILSLESARLRDDTRFGILPENNPYLPVPCQHKRVRDTLQPVIEIWP